MNIWKQIFGSNSKVAQAINNLAPIANPILQSIGQAVVNQAAKESPAGALLASIVAPEVGLAAPVAETLAPEPVLTFTASQWEAFTGNIDAGLQKLGMPSSADQAVNDVIASAATAAGFTVPPLDPTPAG